MDLIPKKLNEPLTWRKPRRVFVNSMSDLFHERLPVEAIAQVFDVMASATLSCDPRRRRRHEHEGECWSGPSHTFQVLTKRPARMLELLRPGGELEHLLDNYFSGDAAINVSREVGRWPLPNVWLGVSVEDQDNADERIPLLLQTPAAVRFLSAEPLLGAVDLRPFLSRSLEVGPDGQFSDRTGINGRLHWVIVGGESGPKARPMDLGWARRILYDCSEAGVPVFMKQVGTNPVGMEELADFPDGTTRVSRGISRGKGGDTEEWPEDLRVREFPREAAPA